MGISHKTIFPAVLLALLGSPLARAQVPASPSLTTPLKWSTFFQNHKNQSKFTLGIRMGGVRPLDLNQSLPMLPASNQKIITAITALKILGDDYQFKNRFDADIDVAARTAGNIVFKVSGDPTWGHDRYEGALTSIRGRDYSNARLVSANIRSRLTGVIQALKEKGVQRVLGPIDVKLIHPELDLLPRPEGWKSFWDLQCMATLPTSFQLNRNCGVFQIRSPREYGWITDGVDVPVTVEVVEGAGLPRITPKFDGLGKITEYLITGEIPATGFTADLPVHMPGGKWLQNLFVKMLTENGFVYEELALNNRDEHVAVDLSSPRLLDILKVAYPYSINTVMDRLFYEVAFHLGVSNAAEPFQNTFRELVQDEVLLEGNEIFDGSGLDVRNRVRPDALYALLSNVTRADYFQSFFDIQVRPGRPGTLSVRMHKNPLTRDTIFAKTGTLSNANNLSGYFVSPQKKLLPFVVLTASMPDVSESQGRAFVDAVVTNFVAQNTPAKRAVH